jgi:hypothetical protein
MDGLFAHAISVDLDADIDGMLDDDADVDVDCGSGSFVNCCTGGKELLTANRLLISLTVTVPWQFVACASRSRSAAAAVLPTRRNSPLMYLISGIATVLRLLLIVLLLLLL